MTDATQYTMQVSEKLLKSDIISFDIADKKGRQLGLDIRVWECEYLPHDGVHHNRYKEPVGVGIYVTIQQTRNGNWYGASQSCTRFVTVEAAQAHIHKTIAKRRATYTKQFA